MSFNFMNYNFDKQQQQQHPRIKPQFQRYPQQHFQQQHPQQVPSPSTTTSYYLQPFTSPESIASPFTTPPPPSTPPVSVSAPLGGGGGSGTPVLQIGGCGNGPPPLVLPQPHSHPHPHPQGRMSGDPPATQLFISNIPSRVREEEIVALFRPFPGFISGRLRRTKMNNYIAFVEFDTIENSGKARDTLNGYNFDTKMVPTNNTAYTRQQIKQFGIAVDFSRVQSNNNSSNNNNSGSAINNGIKQQQHHHQHQQQQQHNQQHQQPLQSMELGGSGSNGNNVAIFNDDLSNFHFPQSKFYVFHFILK